ncbi:MBL fold metallo-hydrolase [Persicimonas caeni]|uniref:MBL fold metallo-hydrolase n=1 Tax=Persicimonas caeni TaxID=2292766 RepID=A0A4Y6Q1K9_PERCE|nr:MBL fold metallo-hydrolase [Persicimonas caeni]QED35106.1 MBL fold metallo-hydrolase [Persicimonas caeni]
MSTREDAVEEITLAEPTRVAPDTFALSSYVPLPGLGVLPVNAFLVRAQQPILVDAGLSATREALLARLEELVDLDELRWIWLTHTDPDHIGAIELLLERAPNARVVTTYLGMGKMGLHRPLPPERVYLLNPGQELDLGDRKLFALRPPTYDAPETTAAFDPKTRALFAADCFGTLMKAPAQTAAEIHPDELRDGMITWASVDAPWLEFIDEEAFEASVRALERLAPKYVFSGHLPPAEDLSDTLAACLRDARGVTPFVGPDQATMEAMMGEEPPSGEARA